MSRHGKLGGLEQMVLLAVWRVGDEAYGLSVRDELEATIGRRHSVSTIYLTLSRLADKGLLEDRLGTPDPEPGGRAKRFFHLTEAGREALMRERETMESLWRGLPTPAD